MENTTQQLLKTPPKSEILSASIEILYQSIGVNVNAGMFINKERTHVMAESSDYHSDWDDKVRPVTDADRAVLLHIDYLTEMRDKAIIAELTRQVEIAKHQLKHAETRLQMMTRHIEQSKPSSTDAEA